MELELTEGGDTEVDEAVENIVEVNLKQRASIGKGGKKRDQGKRDLDQQGDPSAFQPCDDDQSLPDLDPDTLDDFNVDDNVENVDDWVSDKQITELSRKNPSKLTKTMALERPTWKGGPALRQAVGGPSTRGVGGSTPSMPGVGGPTLILNLRGSSQAGSALGVSGQHIPTTSTPAEPPLDVSGQDIPTTCIPAELPMVTGDVSDLVFSPGTRRIKLTMQHPLVQLVIRTSFENLYSLLVSINAFPDGAISVRFVKEALLRAALKYTPGTASIHRRLMNEHDYFCTILPLPRIRMSVFRSEIKGHCSTAVALEMAAIGEPTEIAQYVNLQLQEYSYTCPAALNVPLPGTRETHTPVP